MTTSRIAVIVRSNLEVTHLHAPQVNLNGTAADDLMEEIRVAAMAIQEAVKKLEAVTVNGRDWQTVDEPSEFHMARQEHVERLRKLSQVREELMVIWQDIDQQVGR